MDNPMDNFVAVSSTETATNQAHFQEPGFWESMQYDEIKCILSAMTANERLQLSIWSPSFRAIEKTFPLHLENVSFNEHGFIMIDDTTYRLGVIIDLLEPYPPYVPTRGDRGSPKNRIMGWNGKGGLYYDIDDNLMPLPVVLTPGDIHFHPFGYQIRERLHDNSQKVFFNAHLQLTIESPHGKKVYRRPYDVKLCDAFKTMTTNMLGGRGPIEVEKLSFADSYFHVVRLPEGLTFKVKDLQWYRQMSAFYEQIVPILDYSSLATLHLYLDYMEVEDFQHPIVKNCPKLTCFNYNIPVLENSEYYEVLPKHMEVTYRAEKGWNLALDPVLLVKQWIRADREIGTFFSFSYDDGGRPEFFESLELEFHVAGEQSVTIPMNETKEINVWVTEQLDRNQEEEWILKFEIVAAGTNKTTSE